MALFCQRCRKPMRSRSRAIHRRCQLSLALADDLYALKLSMSVPAKRLARDLGVDYDVMLEALRLAQRRRTAALLAASVAGAAELDAQLRRVWAR